MYIEPTGTIVNEVPRRRYPCDRAAGGFNDGPHHVETPANAPTGLVLGRLYEGFGGRPVDLIGELHGENTGLSQRAENVPYLSFERLIVYVLGNEMGNDKVEELTRETPGIEPLTLC